MAARNSYDTSHDVKPTVASDPSARQAVLVLGMHRSGTSALTRVLNILGCDLPCSLMGGDASNETGHWESKAIRELNDRVLDSGGSAWNDWRSFNRNWYHTVRRDEYLAETAGVVASEFGASKLFVLKDPRICRILPLWRSALEAAKIDAKAVFILRNPMEVAASLKARNGFDEVISLLLWLRHVLDAERDSRGLRRHFLTYDDMLSDWWGPLGAAQDKLGFYWPRLSDPVRAEVSSYLTRRLRHHHRGTEDIRTHGFFADWLSEVWEILSRWAKQGEMAEDHPALDAISGGLADAEEILGAILNCVQTQQEQIDRTEKEVGHLRGEAGKRGDRIKELESALTQAKHQAGLTEKEVAHLRGEAGKRGDRIKELESALTQAKHQAGLTEKEVAHLRGEAGKRGDRIKELESALTQAKHQAGLTEKEVAHLREVAGKQGDWLKELEVALTQAKQRGDTLSVELVQTQSALRQRQHETEQTAQELVEARQDIDILENEKAALAQELTATRSQLRLREREQAEAIRQNEERIDEIAALVGLLDRMAGQLRHVAANGDEVSSWVGKTISVLIRQAHRPYFTKRTILRRQVALLRSSGLFDPDWYASTNKDVLESGIDPAEHFIRFGLSEGREPCAELSRLRAERHRVDEPLQLPVVPPKATLNSKFK